MGNYGTSRHSGELGAGSDEISGLLGAIYGHWFDQRVGNTRERGLQRFLWNGLFDPYCGSPWQAMAYEVATASRFRISLYTARLPAFNWMGSCEKPRGFRTRLSLGLPVRGHRSAHAAGRRCHDTRDAQIGMSVH